MQVLRVVLFGFALFTLSACSEVNNTYFALADDEPPEGVTRIYVDAFGQLYPSSGLDEDFDASETYEASLEKAMLDQESGLCGSATDGSQTERLCVAIEGGNWHAEQIALWADRAQEILESADAKAGNVDLIFLIHGFNTNAENAANEYEKARETIAELSSGDRRQHFVEIYWDGFFTEGLPVTAWAKAQSAGPLVGYQMRRLMQPLARELEAYQDSDIRVRFLTHSSGAFVVGAMFGDPIAALPLLQNPSDGNPDIETDYEFFDQLRNNVNPNFPNGVSTFENLMIGMLAPATSDWTFVGNSDYPEAGFLTEGATVLFSVKPEDEVLNKRGLGADFADTGSTGLGVDIERHYCNHLRANSRLADKGIRFIAYDFSAMEEANSERLSSHSFTDYLDQAAEHPHFMTDLFGTAAIDYAAQEARICG